MRRGVVAPCTDGNEVVLAFADVAMASYAGLPSGNGSRAQRGATPRPSIPLDGSRSSMRPIVAIATVLLADLGGTGELPRSTSTCDEPQATDTIVPSKSDWMLPRRW